MSIITFSIWPPRKSRLRGDVGISMISRTGELLEAIGPMAGSAPSALTESLRECWQTAPTQRRQPSFDRSTKQLCCRHPVQWNLLERRLNSLVALGPSMKVWSRLLCLVRPDLYCTIASQVVRRHLSTVFHIPQCRIAQVEGYVELLVAIHACPWFNSPQPEQCKSSACMGTTRCSSRCSILRGERKC